MWSADRAGEDVVFPRWTASRIPPEVVLCRLPSDPTAIQSRLAAGVVAMSWCRVLVAVSKVTTLGKTISSLG